MSSLEKLCIKAVNDIIMNANDPKSIINKLPNNIVFKILHYDDDRYITHRLTYAKHNDSLYYNIGYNFNKKTKFSDGDIALTMNTTTITIDKNMIVDNKIIFLVTMNKDKIISSKQLT